ncbi:MAG: hypothetical protein ACRD4G_04880, partial [Bryobacteraceae bacterium]
TLAFGALLLVSPSARAGSQDVHVPLNVAVGTPLRIYLTKKVRFRKGAPAQGKFAQPVWSFDRIVIPMGTIIRGRVAILQPIPRMERATAMMGGNFTPLKIAKISFSELVLPDGKTIAIQTRASLALPGLYAPPRPSKKRHHAPKSGIRAKAVRLRRLAEQQMNSQINARTHGGWDFVRSRNRREWLEDFLLNKLPYRPQWYRKDTLFNAVLSKSLHFGTIVVTRQYLQSIGTEPAPNSMAEVRMLSTLSSAHAHVGDPMRGVLSAPLFGAHHRLILPQGTKVTGRVTFVRHARLLHRGGRLRFIIQDIKPPVFPLPRIVAVRDPPARRPVTAQVIAVQADPKKLKVDNEGGAHATSSKTRLLRPLIAAAVAVKSMDNDTGKAASGGGAGSPNSAGLALGGFSGFGMFGLLAGDAPAGIGMALGYYGLGWSVYSNVVARGSEVVFPKNTEIAIRFGRPPPKKKK